MPTKKPTKRAVKDVKKDIERLNKINKGIREANHKLLALYLRGGDWKWIFEKKPMPQKQEDIEIPLTDKITWVLTAVNVAILISLVIKNV